MAEDNTNFPQLTEQLADNTGGQPQQVSPVDYISDSLKAKASEPSLLESIDTVKADADYFSGIFNSSEDNRLSFNEDRINIREAYTEKSDGSFTTRYDEGYIKGADNEQLYADAQTGVSKWTNGLSKFVGKTVVNTVGGVAGTAWGAISAIASGNVERVYDNDFYDFLDDQNIAMDNFAANYRTQEERDMGFFESATTANFWADDFLGGLSFMAGTIISESIWAAATGGVSLTTTAGRVGLSASKYFQTAKALSKGVKEAQKVSKNYLRKEARNKAAEKAIKYGKGGEILNLMRFTYTGAGYEAGMEARMYQKEQREGFNRDFEGMSGRKPTALEIADFEDNLGKTTNALWATNMALVGTSNFAILGKTFGITSPFKLQSKGLNKVLYGIGTETKLGKAGERLKSTAIKRNKLQKTLGVSKALLRNPFMEGFVEEGGQAASSSAAESYLTSRYNPSEEAMGIAESVYNGMAHTYGTKEGWKEIGLGALIGLVGGEGSSYASGGGLFTEAIGALKDQDGQNKDKDKVSGSVLEAQNLNDNLGTKVADKIFASDFEEKLAHATELQNAQTELSEAEIKGSVMGVANAQGKIMLTSVKNAVDFDYLEDQIKDFELGLDLQDDATIAEYYDTEESEVPAKKKQLVAEYKALGEKYKTAKEFADYTVSNNPKELEGDGKTLIDVHVAKTAIAYQMVMTDIMEENMEGAYDAMMDSVRTLKGKITKEEIQALESVRDLNRASKKQIIKLSKVENNIKLQREQLRLLDIALEKADQVKSKVDTTGNQSDANRVNNLSLRIAKLEEEIVKAEDQRGVLRNEMSLNRETADNLSEQGRQLASELDAIDPLAGTDAVSQATIEDTQNSLKKLDTTFKELAKTNPQMVDRITRLGQEYRSGLEMWQRNAETMQALTDPEIGLKRVGTMLQKKKTAGKTTLEFLEGLKKTKSEEQAFAIKIDGLVLKKEEAAENAKTEVAIAKEEVTPNEDLDEQTQAEENKGDDVLTEEVTAGTTQDKVKELKAALKKLIGENAYVLQNFTNNAEELDQDKAPTQEEVDEYTKLRGDFVSGDINQLIGRPVEEIGNRIKEKSGFTDTQITRYQELSKKLRAWRIVTGSNTDGISIQDILNQVAAYEMEVTEGFAPGTAEQVLEMTKGQEGEFSVGTKNGDIAQTMTYVNIGKNGKNIEISHLDIKTLEANGFTVTKVAEESPNVYQTTEVFQISKGEDSFKIRRVRGTSRLVIAKENRDTFFELMGYTAVNYKLKTAWGYVFQNGKLVKSDFGLDNVDGQRLHPEEIYKMKPGDKIQFAVSIADVYNLETIQPLIEEAQVLKGKEKEAKLAEARDKMAIYIQNSSGQTLGLLKAGMEIDEANFNEVREEAFKVLVKKLENNDITIENVANNEGGTIFKLAFETKVEKVFIGSPNIQLDENDKVKVFSIPETAINNSIVGHGFATKGKLSESDDTVRMTFIPKEKSTPYVIIKQGETKIAFPVGLSRAVSTVQQEVMDIIDSEINEQDKLTNIAVLLKENGIEPAEFNLDILKNNNSKELNRLLVALEDATRTYTPRETIAMSLEEFAEIAEIVIDLNEEAFVSPKVKINLSGELDNVATNESKKDKALTFEEKETLMVNHYRELSKATTLEEVEDIVKSIGDKNLEKTFFNNSTFRKQIEKMALDNSVVPSINTPVSIANLLQDIINLESEYVPLDLQEEFRQEVQDIKDNPSQEKLKALAQKVLKASENRYKVVKASVDTKNTYHIPTTENEQQMFEQGYVKISEDMYKKIDNKYSVRQLIEGLHNKHKISFLPSHMNVPEGISLDEFTNTMPNNLLEIYKKYYNVKEEIAPSKSAAAIKNDKYIREDFKGEFAKFKAEQEAIGSDLFKDVLDHLQVTDKGILKDNLLTRGKIDKYEMELGDMYKSLLDYSLINKHIDLQEQPQMIIFAENTEDLDDINRKKAVNNPSLPKAVGKAELALDGSLVLSRENPTFVKFNNSVYEKSFTNNTGETVFEKIADIDPNFLITEVAAPFSKITRKESTEINGEQLKINFTEGSPLDC